MESHRKSLGFKFMLEIINLAYQLKSQSIILLDHPGFKFYAKFGFEEIDSNKWKLTLAG